MKFQFSKYQATGNDFVVLDGRHTSLPSDGDLLQQICHRRFGIGADGVITVKEHDIHDFEVLYQNPDGSESFCGNGTRAAVAFARDIGLISKAETSFQAFDGVHSAKILEDGEVRLKMSDVHSVRFLRDGTFVDTGSPHLVRFVDNVAETDVFHIGRKLRYSVDGGTNVNFVQPMGKSSLAIRTYERGVEDETYSCGTGVTASVMAASLDGMESPIEVETKGGKLRVEFTRSDQNAFTEVYLTGPAKCVFKGTFQLEIN